MIKLNEGPGAGYTISWKDYDDVTVNSFSVNDDGSGWITITVDATGFIFDVSAESYEYGEDDIKRAPIAITEIILDSGSVEYYLDEYDEEYGVSDGMFDAEIIENIIGDYLRDDNKYIYGGGYIHSTYDGTIASAEESKKYGGGISAKITDQTLIDYIDRSVSGETIYDEYTLTDDGGVIEVYPTDEAARAEAEELINSGAYNHLTCYHDWYRETLDDTEFTNGEKVFEIDENGYIYEDDIDDEYEDEEEYV